MIKQTSYLYVIILLLTSILLWNSYMYWVKSEMPNKIYQNEKIQVLYDPLSPQWTAYDYDIAYREEIQKTPYLIVENIARNAKDIVINLPLFLSQSEQNKKNFYTQFYTTWDFFLQINFASREAIDLYQLRSFVENITKIPPGSHQNLKWINLSFYEYPSNYYAFFQQFSWYSTEMIDLEIWLNGPFPYWFYVDNFIHHARNMVEKNISQKMVKSLRLSINWSQGANVLLLKQGEIDLQNFPTSSLWTSGIILSMNPSGYGKVDGREHAVDFFKKSPINTIELSGFWIKNNGWVALYWF